jgi:hypothetical protein
MPTGRGLINKNRLFAGTYELTEALEKLFEHGAQWVRADFHLHMRADKEFHYDGEKGRFVASYIDALEAAETRLAVITNHNKFDFDFDEFKALRKRARKSGIGVLARVELSVKNGANGIHTLVVFYEERLTRW